MTEIPEHLLKRAKAARDKAETSSTPAAEPAAAASEPASPSDSRIPEHLLQRSKAAKSAKAGDEAPAAESGGAVAVAEKVGAVVAAATAGGGVPIGAGPGGHTQRLLTVVKSGTIQDVKASPGDKVHVVAPSARRRVRPRRSFITAFTSWSSRSSCNAPLLELADFNADTEPVEGAVVLPRPAGTARRCSTR